ncbi:MAG: hypothetical protein WBD22_10180 [Pyrinomonadaceae bacterium]
MTADLRCLFEGEEKEAMMTKETEESLEALPALLKELGIEMGPGDEGELDEDDLAAIARIEKKKAEAATRG